MSLKLFRVTEFAESVFFTPQSQRHAVHPATVVLLAGIWLASVGNLALWQSLWPTLFLSLPQSLAALPDTGTRTGWPALAGAARLAGLAILVMAAALVPLALVCWRWTLKIGITLLLFAAAFGTCILWHQQQAGQAAGINATMLAQLVFGPDRNLGRFFNWECALAVLLVALLPALLLWRTRVRRISFIHNCLINTMFLVVIYAIWTGATAINDPDFQEIVQKHKADPSSVNPVNTLLAAGQVVSKKVALP